MRWPTQTWWQFRRVNESAQLMDEVMDRLGVDVAALARRDCGEAYAAARQRCLQCPKPSECRRWLDASLVMSDAPNFCANGELFRELRKAAPRCPAG